MPFNVNDCIRVHIDGYAADKGYILQIMPNSVYRVLMEERGPNSYMRTEFILFLTDSQMVPFSS